MAKHTSPAEFDAAIRRGFKKTNFEIPRNRISRKEFSFDLPYI